MLHQPLHLNLITHLHKPPVPMGQVPLGPTQLPMPLKLNLEWYPILTMLLVLQHNDHLNFQSFTMNTTLLLIQVLVITWPKFAHWHWNCVQTSNNAWQFSCSCRWTRHSQTLYILSKAQTQIYCSSLAHPSCTRITCTPLICPSLSASRVSNALCS